MAEIGREIFVGIVSTSAVVIFGKGITQLYESEDPFFPYYLTVTVVTAILFFLLLMFSSVESQFTSFIILVVLIGVFATFLVIWRYIQWDFYIKNLPSSRSKPSGADFNAESYLPYYLLLSSWTLIIVGMIIYFTTDEKNEAISIPIFISLIGLMIYLGICRIVWEVVENKSLLKLSSSQES